MQVQTGWEKSQGYQWLKRKVEYGRKEGRGGILVQFTKTISVHLDKCEDRFFILTVW